MQVTIIEEFMSPAAVYNSRQYGAERAAKIKATQPPGETFRFREALLMLAIGHKKMRIIGSFANAIKHAMEWSTNPALTEADADAFVRKIVREHKRELADRRAIEAGA